MSKGVITLEQQGKERTGHHQQAGDEKGIHHGIAGKELEMKRHNNLMSLSAKKHEDRMMSVSDGSITVVNMQYPAPVPVSVAAA